MSEGTTETGNEGKILLVNSGSRTVDKREENSANRFAEDDNEGDRDTEEETEDSYDSSDIRLSENNWEYNIKEEIQQKRSLDIRNPPKPCYYPSQEYAASAITKRIRFILYHYHGKRQLESFTEFDFRIYTARSNMLEDQTLSRLCNRRAKCFSEEDYADKTKLRAKAKQRIRKYIKEATGSELRELEEDVVKNPDKLFLIVADEAHWGIIKGGANDKLINAWNHEKHPNVVVLLVTATPWNLLTEYSRLPVVNVAEALDDGKFIVVDTGQYDLRHKKLIDQDGKDVTNEVGSVKELHVFKWTENYEHLFENGLVLSLRVPHKFKKDCIWLTLDKRTSETSFYSVIGTNDEKEAIPFLLKGTNGIVTITTEDESLILTVKDRNVGFTKTGSDQVKATSELFNVHIDHGENVIEFQSVSAEPKFSNLKYIYKNEKVELGQSPAADAKMEVALTYCFLIDSQKRFDEIEPGPQYLSLNFYYNSIRNAATEQQLIRCDMESSAMIHNLEKYASDDILAAEYAYYVSLINLIRRTFKTGNLLQLVEHWELYAGERNTILNSVRLELKELNLDLHLEDKPVSLDVFNAVVDYIEQKAWGNLQTTRKKVKENWSHEDSENFLLNLLHPNFEKLAEHMKEMLETLKRVQPLNVEHSRDCGYKEIASKVLSKNETFRIINDLIQLESGIEDEMNGHMKIFRATKVDAGNRFYATLTLARNIGNKGEHWFFEVIRYFNLGSSNNQINASITRRIWQTLQRKKCSNFSASNSYERCDCKEYESKHGSIVCRHCLHIHNCLEHFSDLDRLPCIVIVVEKGRLGDTFPPSFNALDLRARQTSKPKLSSLQQQIGRLCRYQNKFNYSQIPYVLIAPELMDVFKRNLDTCPDLQTSFRGKDVDNYTLGPWNTRTSSDRRSLRPTEKSYDFDNETKHNNRLLLQAEPQIGKTGVFLKVISLFRQLITKQRDSVETNSDESDEDSDSEEERSSPVELLADDWQFPYWETMAKDEPLKKEIKGSKYDRLDGPYIHNKPPSYRGTATPKRTSHTPQRTAIKCEYSKFRMLSRTEHNSCTDCLSSATIVLKEWTISLGSNKVPIKISVPRLQRFTGLLNKLNATLSNEEQKSRNAPIINTWIFNPSYRESDIVTVNYHHSMICPETNSSCQYVQILVVRSKDFVSYCEDWQTTHAILQLPETLPDCDVDVNTGGIGFARRAIQLFAEALKLDYIFVLDDNIYKISSVKFSELTPEGDVQFEEVSLYTVLKQLETLFSCEKAPKRNFLPYSNQKDRLTCQCSRSTEDLHFYTGPLESYGVLGIRKFRPTKQSIIRGFKKTHVHSLVLLNIHALRKQNVCYKPWPVREDCNLNNDCDDRGLNVCKFNRFALYKKPLLSVCCPSMYFWPEDVELLINKMPEAKSAAETTLRWIQLGAPPKRLEIMDQDFNERTPTHASKIRDYLNRKLSSDEYLPDDRIKCYSDLSFILNRILKTSIGKSHLVACLSDTAQIKDVHSYFQKTKGVGGFDVHLVIFPSFLCHRIQTTTVEHFRKKLIDPLFDEKTIFDVVTSHNILEYAVPFIILYIRGNIQNPLDRKKIGNVGLLEIGKGSAFQMQVPSSEKVQSVTSQDDYKGEDEHQTNPQRMHRHSDQIRGGQTNPEAAEIEKEFEDLSLQDWRIYNQRTDAIRPLEKGATLATDEDVVEIIKPGARILENIIRKFSITRAQ